MQSRNYLLLASLWSCRCSSQLAREASRKSWGRHSSERERGAISMPEDYLGMLQPACFRGTKRQH
jgi:hypothetical protein